MSIRMWELAEGRKSAAKQEDYVFMLDGTSDVVEARLYASDWTPAYTGGLWRQPISVEQIGPSLFKIPLSYAPRDRDNGGGEIQLSFDTSGGTQRITQSLETIARYAPEGETAPDHQGAIGVTPDGVEGVDIVVPVFNFSITAPFAAAAVSNAYVDMLFRMTGRVNAGPFLNFAAGEVLLQGASGSRNGLADDDPWEIGFKFAASENVDGITIGEITGISKRGWEYLWVEYREQRHGTAARLIRKPIAAHVERVYRDGDFDALGLT